METLLRELAEDIQTIEKYNQPMDSASWGYEEGILITGDEAKEILKHTAQLQADKAELLEGLAKISKVTDEGYISAETNFQDWELELEKVHNEVKYLIQKHKK